MRVNGRAAQVHMREASCPGRQKEVSEVRGHRAEVCQGGECECG